MIASTAPSHLPDITAALGIRLSWSMIVTIIPVLGLLGLATNTTAAPGDGAGAAHVLDVQRFPDAAWAKRLTQGQEQAAIDAYVHDLRTGADRFAPDASVVLLYRNWLQREFGQSGGHNLRPDDIVRQHYVGVYGIEHTFTGDIDWRYNPSEGAQRTGEWTWQFNRHYQWIHLADAYARTGDARYARAWEKELRSWIAQCPPPTEDDRRTAFAWRTIEAGIRAGWTWPYAFHVFSRSEHVSDEALWLFVRAMHDHGQYLSKHHGSKNWLTMETNGLAHVGLMFPELIGAPEFAATAGRRVSDMVAAQFYPDGMHYELAPSYGLLSIISLYAPTKLAQVRGPALSGGGPLDGWQVDTVMHALVNATRALACLADPHGNVPPIHDSSAPDIKQVYLDIVPDADASTASWASNDSTLLPWSGFAILRRDGRFTVLDGGPWGAGHQHADALQILLFAHDRWLLIDPGKPQYNRSDVTRHLRSSAGHNVVLMDGLRHQPVPKTAILREPAPMTVVTDGPIHVAAAKRAARTDRAGDTPSETSRQSAHAMFDHERIVLDLPDELGILVVDRLWPRAQQTAYSWEWLWHTAAERIDITPAGQAIMIDQQGPVLAAQAASTARIAWTVTKGQTNPQLRGWRSTDEANTPTPTPVLRLIADADTGPIITTTWLRPLSLSDARLNRPGDQVSLSTDDAAAPIRITLTTSAGQTRFLLQGSDQIQQIDYQLPDNTADTLSLQEH